MKDIESRIAAIEKRNAKVENDKAWETSWARRTGIAGLTYLVVLSYLTIVVHNDRPLVNAVVPTVGYLLSTLAMSGIRNLWDKRYDRQA